VCDSISIIRRCEKRWKLRKNREAIAFRVKRKFPAAWKRTKEGRKIIDDWNLQRLSNVTCACDKKRINQRIRDSRIISAYYIVYEVTVHNKSKLYEWPKGKDTLVQALRLCTGRTAHRGSRGIALPFHNHGTRRGWGVSVTPRPLFTPGKDPVPIVQETGWAPGPVWTGAENLAATGIRSADLSARGQSLYLLRYPAHTNGWRFKRICFVVVEWGQLVKR